MTTMTTTQQAQQRTSPKPLCTWPKPSKPSRAFTLMELLVSIAIIALVAALAFPTLRAMVKTSNIGAGISTIQVATTAAKTFAIRDLNGKFQNIGPDATDTQSYGHTGNYSGVAMLFTPGNEIRLVENVPYANKGNTSDTQYFLELKPSSGGDPYNGYADLPDIAYIKIPPGTAMMGIVRGTSTLYYFPPPFAIRFNEKGHLVVGRTRQWGVVYDKEYDGDWFASNTRPNTYSPDQWDPTSDTFVNANFDSTENKLKLPFEFIDAVVGILVYDKEKFRARFSPLVYRYALSNSSTYDDTTPEGWLQQNGRAILFNRYSGTMIKSDKVMP